MLYLGDLVSNDFVAYSLREVVYNILVTQLRSAEGRINSFQQVISLLRRFLGYFIALRLRKSDHERIKPTKTFKRNLKLVLFITASENVASYKGNLRDWKDGKISIFEKYCQAIGRYDGFNLSNPID